jgi:hypothetical protein
MTPFGYLISSIQSRITHCQMRWIDTQSNVTRMHNLYLESSFGELRQLRQTMRPHVRQLMSANKFVINLELAVSGTS